MKPWAQLAYRSRRQTQLADALAQLRDFSCEISAGRRRYRVRVAQATPAAWTPIRLRANCSLGTGHVDLDLCAIDPVLSNTVAGRIAAESLDAALAAQGAHLCVLEGLIGTELQFDHGTLQRRPRRSALVLEIYDGNTCRIGHIGLSGPDLVGAVQRRQEFAAWQSRQQQQMRDPLRVRAWICFRASRLGFGQLARARVGAVMRIANEQLLLRLRLAHGHVDFPLSLQDTRCMIQSPPSQPPPGTAASVAVDQIMLDMDVVLASLRLSVEEISRLRPGTTLELPTPLSRSDVVLRCEGTPFAYGELVRVGERLGVVIERLSGMPAP